jgi:lactate dehydrogenase-like 2-hydroxyacid dehydrogenase
MFNKMLFIGYVENQLEKEHWNRIDRICKKKVLLPRDDPSIDEHLKDSDCLLVKVGAHVGKEIIDKAPILKYIGMFGTGVGRIDIAYATEKNVTICNIQGYSSEGVAEFVFGVLLEYLRDIEQGKCRPGTKYSMNLPFLTLQKSWGRTSEL